MKLTYMHCEQEAILLTKYLAKKSPLPEVIKLYEKALQAIPFQFSEKDERIWNFCMHHSWSLGLIDAGLAFGQTYHPVRKRIYIMLAILETQPAYSDCFLPKERSVMYNFYIFFCLVKAAFKMVVGKILLWFI
jgi:hypothetical protein